MLHLVFTLTLLLLVSRLYSQQIKPAINILSACQRFDQDNPGNNIYKKYKVKKAVFLSSSVASYTGITYLGYLYLDMPVKKWSQENKTSFTSDLSSAGKFIGRHKTLMAGAIGLTISGCFIDKKLRKVGLLSLISLSINDVISYRIKSSVQRHRPESGSPYNTFGYEGDIKHHSFPSSHTSGAFCMATIIATIYKDKKAVPIIAYSAASLIGISRIHDNGHWTSDVLAGAAIGFLTAKGVIFLHNLADKKIKKKIVFR